MYTLSPKELKLVRASVGLIETDTTTFNQNLRRLGHLTVKEARMLFQKALNAKAVQEDRGWVRMAPPPRDPRELTAFEVSELKQDGYSVYVAYDGDPPLYGWLHASSGAAQSGLNGRQPFRRTQGQAWVDCRNYVRGAVPSVAEPDWKN